MYCNFYWQTRTGCNTFGMFYWQSIKKKIDCPFLSSTINATYCLWIKGNGQSIKTYWAHWSHNIFLWIVFPWPCQAKLLIPVFFIESEGGLIDFRRLHCNGFNFFASVVWLSRIERSIWEVSRWLPNIRFSTQNGSLILHPVVYYEVDGFDHPDLWRNINDESTKHFHFQSQLIATIFLFLFMFG